MIKTFSSRAGRLSETNKFYLHKKSKCIFSEKKLIIHKQKVLDVGFGDSDSFCKDIIENNDFFFFGAEPYKKGFSRAVEFFEKNDVENMILFNGDVRELLEKVKFCFDFIRIHFPDPWPKKKHIKRRLVTKEFLIYLSNKLSDNGLIQIITDSQNYQDHMKEEIKLQNKLSLSKRVFPITYNESSFYKKALIKKNKIKEFILQKSS